MINQMNIIDDDVFEKMAESSEFCEEMISTIVNQKVKVIKVVPQKSVKNLQGRSVRLDALCELENGVQCTVEVQKSDDDHHEKRIRYNTSCVTTNITEPGSKFEKVPNVMGIFISKFDIFKKKNTEHDTYDFQKFPKISARKWQFFKEEEGAKEMCELFENYAKKKAIEIVQLLFKNGADFEMVKKSVLLISEDELREIYETV